MKYIVSTSVLPYYDKKTVVAGFEGEVIEKLANYYALARSEGRPLIDLRNYGTPFAGERYFEATYQLPNNKTIIHTFTVWPKIEGV